MAFFYCRQQWYIVNKCITIMKKFTKTKVLRVTEDQHNTLVKMKSYNVDVSEFIRRAIAEKIKRDYEDLIPEKKDVYCPF